MVKRKFRVQIAAAIALACSQAWSWSWPWQAKRPEAPPENLVAVEEKLAWFVQQFAPFYEAGGCNSASVRLYAQKPNKVKLWIRDPAWCADAGYGNDFNNDLGECAAQGDTASLLQDLQSMGWSGVLVPILDLNGKVTRIYRPFVPSWWNELCGECGMDGNKPMSYCRQRAEE